MTSASSPTVSGSQLSCRCCGQSQLVPLFEKAILLRYSVTYHQCQTCGYLQTDEPYWLEEAYAIDAISDLDTGLVQRCLAVARQLQHLLPKLAAADNSNPTSQYLDFAGGNGLLVRLLRDAGYNFYRFDEYCDNQFSKHFDVDSLEAGQSYAAITACEVFEHLLAPADTLHTLLQLSPFVFLTTELLPSATSVMPADTELSAWEYLVPETGQHIGFFSLTALQSMAKQTGSHLYSDGATRHLFSRMALPLEPLGLKKWLYPQPIKLSLWQRLRNKIARLLMSKPSSASASSGSKKTEPSSLMMSDFYHIKNQLHAELATANKLKTTHNTNQSNKSSS